MQVAKLVFDQVLGRLRGGAVADPQFQRFSNPVHASVANAFLSQRGANVPGKDLRFLGQGAIHVNLKQKMHATTQVKAQIHGRSMQRLQPGWRSRQEVQSHHVCRVGRIRVERLFDGIASFELGISVTEPRFDGGAIQLNGIGLDVVGFQRHLDAGDCGGIQFDGGFAG